MKALILVDIQNDFLPGGALAVAEGDQVIGVANRLMELKGSFFSKVIATQDWHPAEHKSFASKHPGKRPGEIVDLNGLTQVLWPNHCVQNSRGAEFSAKLKTSEIDAIIQKGTDAEIDSYSGFFDNGRRKSTAMADTLKKLNITEAYVMGLATDYCVKFTALDAASLGFKTFLITDGCRGVNLKPDDSKNSIEEMKKAGIQITESEKLR